jgi:hypothetical protein
MHLPPSRLYRDLGLHAAACIEGLDVMEKPHDGAFLTSAI